MTRFSLVPSDTGHIFQESAPDRESNENLVLVIHGLLLFG